MILETSRMYFEKMDWIKIDKIKLLKEYEEGNSIRELSRKYGISRITIKKKLKSVGINNFDYVNNHSNKFKELSKPIKKTGQYINQFEPPKDKLFENFKKKSNKIHNNRYDYSKAKYINHTTPIDIICPVHGVFKQTPESHLKNHGCPKCGHIKTSQKLTLNKNEFINRANHMHNHKYDYSMIDYKSCKDHAIIICPHHGEFTQQISIHLKGYGCPKCSKYTKDSFISKAKQVHQDKYDYRQSDYHNSKTKVKILCSKCGEYFYQIPNNHISGSGCPKCAASLTSSQGELELVEFIKSIYDGKILQNNRQAIYPLELDIYLPDVKLAIEYNGSFWHSSNNELDDKEKKNKHQNKMMACKSKDITLLQFFEHEWLNKTDIVKNIIKSKLRKINKSIYARNCSIHNVSNSDYKTFLNNNHLQGAGSGCSVKLGLYNNNDNDNELIMIMSFKKETQMWSIERLASKLNLNVVGGASKLFKHFVKNYNPKIVKTFASANYSNGDVYKKLKFIECGLSSPGYFYLQGTEAYSRQSFQKHKLKTKLENYNNTLTESQNMFNNSYRRMWDAGNYKFILYVK